MKNIVGNKIFYKLILKEFLDNRSFVLEILIMEKSIC